MSATATETQDREILSLFRQWIEAYRYADEIGQDHDLEDEQHDEACETYRAIEDAIFGIPAQGPVGFAVKAYLDAHDQCPAGRGDPAASLCRYEPALHGHDREAFLNTYGWTISLMRDAARFVPEIAELAAPLIGRPAAPIDYGGNVVRLRPRR